MLNQLIMVGRIIKDVEVSKNENGKKYEFDFVVETKSNFFLVEVRADKNLEDSDAIEKKERAISYCKLVSNWGWK